MKRLLIVIDMQEDFVYGALRNEEAIKIVNNVKNKIISYQNSNDTVIFTKDTHFNETYDKSLEGIKLPVKHCIKGTVGHDLVKELKEFEKDGSLVIEKLTFGYTEWKKIFDDKKISFDEIELVGVCTDICVLSNAIILRAFYPNSIIKVDSNCCAGLSPQKHENALDVMESCQIDVIR